MGLGDGVALGDGGGVGLGVAVGVGIGVAVGVARGGNVHPATTRAVAMAVASRRGEITPRAYRLRRQLERGIEQARRSAISRALVVP